MYLKSLEIAGFKSFPKKISLEFTSSITGIVGPNGSGKSNVAESFRFVLGEQSMKSLRGKRGEDLIWNGGGEAGRANRASVKLTFDNRRRFFQSIDFDEVSIERVVNRDSSNEYLLNGSPVRLKDIAELLVGAHVGASGHHIISQGEADRILSASIKERREMVEDALGLKVYQWKKLESLRKLEKTEENMKQVESLRREIAPHLKFLKKQVEKVEKAEEMRHELVEICRSYFAREDLYIRTEKEKLKTEVAVPKKESEELDRALEQAKNILALSKNKDQKSEQVIAKESALSEIRIEKDRITRESGRIEGEISANKKTIEREKAKIQDEKTKVVYLRDVEEMVVRIEGFVAIDDVKKLFNDVVSTLREFVIRHKSSLDSELVSDCEVIISRLENEKRDCDNRLAELMQSESQLHREYNEIKNQIEIEKDTDRDAEKEVFRIIARQNEVRSILSGINSRLTAISYAEETYKKEMGEAGILVGREAVSFDPLNTESGGQTASREEQEAFRRQIERIKIRLEDAGVGGGSEIMKEYKETEERDAFLARELGDLERAKEELNKLIADLDMRIDVEFKTGILKINSEFQKYFVLMFGGGKAELSVVRETKRRKKSETEELSDALSGNEVDTTDELADEQGPEGLEVNISLPRKKIKGLEMLSGGERALTSIALLFAVSQVNPPPFIILDETDAALDEANSKKYGDMIESLSKESQLILITHNRETMSRAGVIYGITMGSDGASRLLSIAFEDAVKVAK
ncbi:MAG: AAA family ATPase [Candidatus Paceibacterota bacterium]